MTTQIKNEVVIPGYIEIHALTQAARQIFGNALIKALASEDKQDEISVTALPSNKPVIHIDEEASVVLCFVSGRRIKIAASEFSTISTF